jgi:hypothetical protein
MTKAMSAKRIVLPSTVQLHDLNPKNMQQNNVDLKLTRDEALLMATNIMALALAPGCHTVQIRGRRSDLICSVLGYGINGRIRPKEKRLNRRKATP